MRIRKLISQTLTTLLLLIFILMAASVIISRAGGGEPNFFGYQIKTVLSGSMEPFIRTGSIIMIKPDEKKDQFAKGDVITFRSKDKLITHRIVEVLNNKNQQQVMYRTQGDHNDAPDLEAVPSGNVIGKYTGFQLPYLGYAMNFANSKAGSVLLLIVPGLLLLVYSIISTWKAISTLDKKTELQSGASDSATP